MLKELELLHSRLSMMIFYGHINVSREIYILNFGTMHCEVAIKVKILKKVLSLIVQKLKKVEHLQFLIDQVEKRVTDTKHVAKNKIPATLSRRI